jgi:xyloglucan-specific exo-beta-1,4-glucanase
MFRSSSVVGALFAGVCLVSWAISAEPYKWGNVRFEGGGFVTGIVTSKTQSGLVYARTDVGGAYRWDSLGGKWIPLMDWISEKDGSLYGTEAIALDPHDSKRLFILTGMHYNTSGKSMILRSFDYGASFDTVNVSTLFKAHGNGRGRQSGEKLAVDPLNSAVLFCGTRLSGLWKSSDTGKTWKQISAIGAATDTNFSNLVSNNGLSFVLFDSTSGKAANGVTRVIFVGSSKNGSPSLYKSNDGGATFAEVSGAPAEMAMRAVLGNGFLYGTFSIGEGPDKQNNGSVWKMEIASGVWTKITPKDDSGFAYASGREGYGYAFGGITIDPKNPKRLLLSTIGCYGGNNSWPDGSGNAGDIFFLSEDAGATWKVLNPWSATTPIEDANGNGWVSGGNIHWAGTLEFDPFDAKKVWVGSGNGVFRTDDVTTAVPLWKFQSKGIEETVPMEVVSIPGGPLVTAIMDYDGATYFDITKSEPQHDHPIGSSNSLGYGAKVGWISRSGRVTDYGVKPAVTYDVMYLSKDKGVTWAMTDTSSLPGSGGVLAISADGSALLMRPANLHNGTNASASTFYRSVDEGKTWKPVTGLAVDGTKFIPLVADPVNPANFYMVPDGYTGDVYASTDTGKSFAKISKIMNPKDNFSPASSSLLRAAPGAAGDLWLCLDAEQPWNKSGYSSNGLAHSTDGGKTWTYLNTMDGCLSIGLGKAAPGASYYALYMWGGANGGPRGIYRSIDKGGTWIRVNDDQHQYGGPANGKFVVGDFNVYGRVYMSSAGRGLIYGEPAGTNSVDPSAARPTSLRRMGGFVTGNGVDEIRLVDIRGRLVRRSEIVGGVARVDLAGLPRGVYLARTETEAMAIETAR